MKTLILFLTLFTLNLFAQSNLPSNIPDNLTGFHYKYDFQKGLIITTNPVVYNSNNVVEPPNATKDHPDSNTSHVKFSFGDGQAIGTYSVVAGNGLKSVVGWYLNNERTTCFGNTNNTPLWEFPLTQTPLYNNFVAISSDGSKVANNFFNNIYLINGTSGTQLWTFDLTTLPYTVSAGPNAITSTGNFIVASANGSSASDSSSIFCFNSSSNVPVWTIRLGPTGSIGSQLQGVRISGNDSLIIANTYIAVYVIRTYTGQIIYTGTVNPLNNNGTQAPQGISGNGNIIATINYYGYVRVLQWNGSTYNLLWQNQEPPGSFLNWMSAVDVSYDGSMVAGGTLNFLTSSTYDGKVKFWNVAGGSTPVWVYSGTGDELSWVSFSKNGRILSASSWGDFYTHTANNLLVFKTSHTNNVPLYAINDYGSFFSCSTSDNGQTVVGSGKAVHARQFGSGGMYYNLAIDTSENAVGIHNGQINEVHTFRLVQNYPNPFNPTTVIDYQLPKDGLVKLSVFDVLGREINTLVNEYKKAGAYSVQFDASELPSGVYFYKIQSGNFTDTKKMTLIK